MESEKSPPCALARRDAFLTASDAELTEQCVLDFFKTTGNGGQKKNKTSSAVRLIHRPTGLSVTDDAERSQHRNRAAALKKLRMAIALACRAEPAVPPERREVGLTAADYPLFAAHLLDLFAACGYRVSEVAARLDASSSHLTNLLARDHTLLAAINRERAQLALPQLKQNH